MGVFSRPVRRIEDFRLITGRGRYVDDIQFDGAAVAWVLRSPYAHALIRAIDTAEAKKAPGVLGVFTGKDLADQGVGTFKCALPKAYLKNRDGTDRFDGERSVLALDRVRFVGDAVALVVAETRDQAKDAAELIAVDYEELPALATVEEAKAEGASLIWPEAKSNICIDWEVGDAAAAEAAITKAAHVIRLDLVNNRIVVNSMEPRAALARRDPATGRYDLYATSQGAHAILASIAGYAPWIPSGNLRVVSPDVGGGFGMKGSVYPEYVLTLFAAHAVGRPVKWASERMEAFQSDTHGRDLKSHAELALDAQGRMLALRIDTEFNIGAYAHGYGPAIQTFASARILGGVYKIPAVYHRSKAYYTNTVPVDAYRGAGRPEAAYIIERLVDRAARELGMTQDEIRLRNFAQPEDMPFRNAVGTVFDSGDFPKNLADCMRLSRWSEFAARKSEAASRGMLRGIGMAYYIEVTANSPGTIAIGFEPDGRVRLAVGTLSHGQSHETTFSQLLADQLGIPIESIVYVQGDTDRGVGGDVTGGSRSLWSSGNGILKTCAAIVEKGKEVAADMMNARPDEISFDDGAFRRNGTNQFVPLLEVAKTAREKLPEGLDSQETHTGDNSTYPNGCHIAEVEIDPDTGRITLVDYNVVDDFGFVLNPMIVRGQVHGGVVQGLGQALMEHCQYEPGTAQLLTGSFLDYCMPRADDVPSMGFAHNEVLCTTNPLGIKGCGEAGTIGAAPAVMNAILDAVWDRGIRHVDMPMSPLRVWQLLHKNG
ncbi:MAG TPA: xanthine dehydrogenase family protein molybdopterin-binding subunit [Alphaproteobacteria bacterium]|nr:xanthine dehydrogenase family protein molybdopterin-binding subunit [Alphaproteobacteria bacterium]